MCINFLRPPPILICSVYSSAVLWKVIVNCSNTNNEWECVQNQKLQIHLLKNRCLESMLLKLYLNQVFIYRADRSIFIDQSISYGLPYDSTFFPILNSDACIFFRNQFYLYNMSTTNKHNKCLISIQSYSLLSTVTIILLLMKILLTVYSFLLLLNYDQLRLYKLIRKLYK